MYKNILKSLKVAIWLPVILIACKKDSDTGIGLTSKIDLHEEASVVDDRYDLQLWYSVDGGGYTAAPQLSDGKKVKVRVKDLASGEFLTAPAFDFDWSKSNPAPSDATSDEPEFTYNNNAAFHVYIDDHWCPVSPADLAGSYHGQENDLTVDGGAPGAGSNDAMTITVDPDNTTNGIIMSNWFGDGSSVTVKATLSSTNAHDQVITIPEQTTSDPGVASGVGVFDQCGSTFNIDVTYVAFGSTFTWTYVVTRDE